MRKIKSLVNQVRQFPEYLDALDTLNDMISAEKRCYDCCKNIYGNEFIKFYSKQPKTLQTPLTEIRFAGEKQAEIMKQSGQVLTEFKTDFGDLNMINNEIQRKAMTIKDAQTAAANSQAAAAKVSSTENTRKAAEDMKKAETVKNQSGKQISDLQKRFITSLADSLKKVADSRIKIASQINEVSKQFGSLSDGIKEYKDPAIPRLNQRLQQLDYEVAE